MLRPAVHPHMRGAYSATDTHAAASVGSSPHAWGIRLISVKLQSSTRFIPTCVGHTYRSTAERNKRSVHPHMRGAYTRKNAYITPFVLPNIVLCV